MSSEYEYVQMDELLSLESDKKSPTQRQPRKTDSKNGKKTTVPSIQLQTSKPKIPAKVPKKTPKAKAPSPQKQSSQQQTPSQDQGTPKQKSKTTPVPKKEESERVQFVEAGSGESSDESDPDGASASAEKASSDSVKPEEAFETVDVGPKFGELVIVPKKKDIPKVGAKYMKTVDKMMKPREEAETPDQWVKKMEFGDQETPDQNPETSDGAEEFDNPTIYPAAQQLTSLHFEPEDKMKIMEDINKAANEPQTPKSSISNTEEDNLETAISVPPVSAKPEKKPSALLIKLSNPKTIRNILIFLAGFVIGALIVLCITLPLLVGKSKVWPTPAPTPPPPPPNTSSNSSSNSTYAAAVRNPREMQRQSKSPRQQWTSNSTDQQLS